MIMDHKKEEAIIDFWKKKNIYKKAKKRLQMREEFLFAIQEQKISVES